MIPYTFWLVAMFVMVCKAHHFNITRDNKDMSTRNVSGVYRLTDSYNSTNFFDKFNFHESLIDTPEYTDVDPTSGFVLYQNKSEAQRLGLVQTVGDVSIIKVDSDTVIANPTGYGRKSVRLESVNAYNHGLFIADFSHLPQQLCGTWPAFWTYGPDWPTTGEMDIYEQWNDNNFNRQTLHTTYNTTVGNCAYNTTRKLGPDTYGMANHMYSSVCDVHASDNVGCSTWDFEGPFGSAGGGVYAMEWTGESIQMWSWHPQDVPSDVVAGRPDPSTWKMAGLVAGSSLCAIDRAFRNQSVVFNIDFCGDTAGAEWASGCAEKTGYNTCARYVAARPGDFADVWFGVRSIAVYTLQ